MSELHTFLFDGMPVRGMLVRLTDAWTEILHRRSANTETGPYPGAVTELLGEMAAASVLLQSNIKFNGALILQIMGDGPVKLAVAEVQANLGLRATATLAGALPEGTGLADMVNQHGGGRCALTLDPKDRLPGQQPYQGVVPLQAQPDQPYQQLSQVLTHYMRQSEQLDATWVLAANEQVAAGLLIQRMPLKGQANLGGAELAPDTALGEGEDEDYNRIATLAASLTRQELLTLDADSLLHRLFWQERLLRFVPRQGVDGPHFACTCSRARVTGMLRSLGAAEIDAIVQERGNVEVGCDFCGAQYRFDAVDAAQIDTDPGTHPPSTQSMQ